MRFAAFAPLRDTVFRGLWFAWLAANMTMWMNDVAAAWLMTSLTTNPVMVALVQTASTLPVFLLGVPSGAVADIVDRRRYFAATQLWVAATALLLAVLPAAGVAVGYGIGADPMRTLLHTRVGAACAGVACALQVLGLLWTERLSKVDM